MEKVYKSLKPYYTIEDNVLHFVALSVLTIKELIQWLFVLFAFILCIGGYSIAIMIYIIKFVTDYQF